MDMLTAISRASIRSFVINPFAAPVNLTHLRYAAAVQQSACIPYLQKRQHLIFSSSAIVILVVCNVYLGVDGI
jgi:hypothetical protein